MAAPETSRRANQRRRTRKDLLDAAYRLMKQGRNPSLEEVAEEALVSRATAYRYFPSIEALLVEASFDIAVPKPEELFRAEKSADPVVRLELADGALHDMILANETALRMMLAHALQQGLASPNGGKAPRRQNRRTPLIEAALSPARRRFRRGSLDTLSKALALILGPEAVIVCKDVLQLSDEEARRVKGWAIRALVDAAQRSASKS